MKKVLISILVLGLTLSLVYGIALAGQDLNPGNGFPTGRHYNLNIIGVPMDKEVEVRNRFLLYDHTVGEITPQCSLNSNLKWREQ